MIPRLCCVALSLFFLSACTRGDPEQQPNGGGVTSGRMAGETETRGVDERADTPANREREERRPSGERSASQRVENIPSPNLLPVTRNDKLLSIDTVVITYPYDFEVGSLYRPGRDGDAQAIVRVTDRFVGELAEGRFTTETVSSSWIDHLVRSLRPFLESEAEITAARYAEPIVNEKGMAEMGIRLFSHVGSTAGVLFYELEGRAWRIVDFHADLDRLSERPSGRDQPFVPPQSGRR